MEVFVKLKELSDSGYWDEFCDKYGYDYYAMNEGADPDVTYPISIGDAIKYGIYDECGKKIIKQKEIVYIGNNFSSFMKALKEGYRVTPIFPEETLEETIASIEHISQDILIFVDVKLMYDGEATYTGIDVVNKIPKNAFYLTGYDHLNLILEKQEL